ncbi:uncharacterized protein tomb [Drosophila kikkawai]|uniref:Uncharacterized protein tomb n=1 Tax=Drosophila kikkawai TaxID=30033 RepID=A0A6P4IU20_DROKI|nr:uncharacterized protein LOC108081393 [Drosophila kikkawai]KAH8334320.1 hypothetical protein KR059_008823 [Drosophila kikkawai]
MSQTPKRASAKGKGRAQPTAKGCCCKRSQCIKNYCDCYQSMMVCTQFCRCVGCRNTEERMAVEPRTPSRNSNAVKRDRAAAMSAKAAAAAAKEGINIPVPPASSNSIPITIMPAQQPAAIAPINIIRMAPDAFNVVLQQVSPQLPIIGMKTIEVPAAPDIAKDLPVAEVKPTVIEPPNTNFYETHNLFDPQINAAHLVCSLIQGSDAEQLGLEHDQVGRLTIIEFENCYKEISQKMYKL